MNDPLDFELECVCNYCEYAENISVHEADYIAWHNGKFAQTVFRTLQQDSVSL